MGETLKNSPYLAIGFFTPQDLEATSFMSFRTRGGGGTDTAWRTFLEVSSRPGLGSQELMFLLGDSADSSQGLVQNLFLDPGTRGS